MLSGLFHPIEEGVLVVRGSSVLLGWSKDSVDCPSEISSLKSLNQTTWHLDTDLSHCCENILSFRVGICRVK